MHSLESNSNVPAFLVKLWKLVEDPECDALISWSESGTSFIIRNQAKFAKELLPQYFKHNNMASFIRQLNMYGFRKILNIEKGGLLAEHDEMKFYHVFFMKGQEGLLEFIKRKIPSTKSSDATPKQDVVKDLLTDITSIRGKQENMDSLLMSMKKENETLWREVVILRQQHAKQQQIIEKLIQFFASLVQSNRNTGLKRNLPFMIHDSQSSPGKISCLSHQLSLDRNSSNIHYTSTSSLKAESPHGPVIHDVTDMDGDNLSDEVADIATSAEPSNEAIDCPISSNLNSPLNTETIEPLSILDPLQPSVPVLSPESNVLQCEELPEPLVTPLATQDAETTTVANEGIMASDALSAPVSELLALSPTLLVSGKPEDVTVRDSASILEAECKIGNDVLNTEGIDILSPALETVSSEVIIPSLSSAEETLVKDSTSLNTSPVDALLNENINAEENHSSNSNDLQVAVSESNSSVPSQFSKYVFLDHVENVENELDWLQNQLTRGNFNIDSSTLLGLFSTDDLANNSAFTSSFGSDIGNSSKESGNDIIGNELIQYAPSLLEMELDDIEAPLFLDTNAENVDTLTIDSEKQIIDSLKGRKSSHLESDSSNTNVESIAEREILKNNELALHDIKTSTDKKEKSLY